MAGAGRGGEGWRCVNSWFEGMEVSGGCCLRPAGSTRLHLRAQDALGLCTTALHSNGTVQSSVREMRNNIARNPVFFTLRTRRIDFCKVGSLSGPVSCFFVSQKQFLFFYDYLLLQFKIVDMTEWVSLHL